MLGALAFDAHGFVQPSHPAIRHSTITTMAAATVANAICFLQRVVWSGVRSWVSLDLVISVAPGVVGVRMHSMTLL